MEGSAGRQAHCVCWSPAEGRGAGRPDDTLPPWDYCPQLRCLPQVASKAGVYEILNQLGFPELESGQDQPFSRLRCRWQEQSRCPEPSAAGDFL